MHPPAFLASPAFARHFFPNPFAAPFTDNYSHLIFEPKLPERIYLQHPVIWHVFSQRRSAACSSMASRGSSRQQAAIAP
jgi:hypothetical protein